MKSTASWFVVATLGAASLMAVYIQRGKAQYVYPGEVRFQTGCQAVDATTVEGFVTNPGTGLLTVAGPVKFVFTVAGDISHPAIQVQANAVVPPGRTVNVARAKLVWSLLPNEVCQLDVSGAVR